jgi:glycosyltransferase involved in cell wall biosynthesis
MSKVSFVIPVYDGDSYLAETLELILHQRMKDIEIIVIDDASPDFTPELMDWYVKKDERIKYHRLSQNSGVCEARNVGNKMASSELICVCDQDDLCKPWRAGYSYAFFKRYPEINCLTSAYWECNIDGEQIREYVPPDMTRELFESGDFVWMHSSACYRKEDILKIPYRQLDSQTDDWVFLDDWTKADMKFKTVKKVLANCRRLPWGVMQKRRLSMGDQPSFIV